MKTIERLLEIMRILRGKAGCGWDKKQTLDSLKKYLLEETYEVIDSIDNLDMSSKETISHHKEELGDLLLQIVFQSEIQSEHGYFNFDDVARGIIDKMERRHPHIFGNKKHDLESQDNPYWHQIKESENRIKKQSIFASIPKSLPALARATKLGDRAGHLGFDWPNALEALDKVKEEIAEMSEAMVREGMERQEEELGDLLHALAQTARKLGIDPELALQKGNEKFARRFEKILVKAGGEDNFKNLNIAEMTTLWDETKQ